MQQTRIVFLLALLLTACSPEKPDVICQERSSSQPELVFTATGVATGAAHTCAVTERGEIFCWGENSWGDLGDGTWDNRSRPTQEVTRATTWQSVAANGYTCALKTDGSLWCWGGNSPSDRTSETSATQGTPTQEVTKANNWTAVSAGLGHICALKADGSLWCWGANYNGELGDGTSGDSANKSSPTQEATKAYNWTAVSAGLNHTCGLKRDASIWCWGWNGVGLGGGGIAEKNRPTQEVTGAESWTAVVATGHGVCGLKAGGSLWCWSSWGDTPTQESSRATDWSAMAMGRDHTCALKTDGSLWCWGSNGSGQLGNGTTADSSSPVREATNATDWLTVAAGEGHSCGLKTDGSLWCWGNNLYGQLGDGMSGCY